MPEVHRWLNLLDVMSSVPTGQPAGHQACLFAARRRPAPPRRRRSAGPLSSTQGREPGTPTATTVRSAWWQHRLPGSRSPPGLTSRPSGAVRAQVLLGDEVIEGGDGSSIAPVGAGDRRDHDVALVAGPRPRCGDKQQQETRKDGAPPPPSTLMRWSGALSQCRLIVHGPHRHPAMPFRR